MKYSFIDDYILSKKGVIKDYKHEWSATRYMIKDKMFAMLGGDKLGKPIITVKLEPIFGEILRNKYEDIVLGYYMNKQHWNSLYLDGTVPYDVLKDMLDKSYEIVFNALSKKLQKEIL